MADLRDPPTNAIAVVPSDTALLPFVTTNLYIGSVGGGATLTVTMLGGAKVSLAGLTVGFYPMRVNQVWNTGTLASSIVALA